MAEEKKDSAGTGAKKNNRSRSPEKLNEYIRIGGAGGYILIGALILVAAAVIIWGVVGKIPVTLTETCVVVDRYQESHSCICTVDVAKNTGIIPEGNAASVRMPDGKVFEGVVDYSIDTPMSEEEIRQINLTPEGQDPEEFALSDWMLEHLLRDSTYSYVLLIHTEEDISAYWHQLAEATIVINEVAPITFLMK